MTVYIEYVIIDNLIIDYLMLKATFALTGKPYKRGRLFLCAFLGAIIALVYPALEVNSLILTCVKIASGLLIVLLSAEFSSFKSFYINCAVFFGYTFLTGGAIIGVFSLFNVPYSSEYSVALMVIPVYILFRLMAQVVNYGFRRKDVASLTYQIKIVIGDYEKIATGFFDTGNALYDGDKPVIVCGKDFFIKFLAGRLINRKFKKINLITVAGKRENLAFDLDRLLIYIGDEPNIYNNVTVCVASGEIGDGYDFILHPALMEVKNETKTNTEIKKIS